MAILFDLFRDRIAALFRRDCHLTPADRVAELVAGMRQAAARGINADVIGRQKWRPARFDIIVQEDFEPVVGYVKGAFGIHRVGQLLTLTHLPTGYRLVTVLGGQRAVGSLRRRPGEACGLEQRRPLHSSDIRASSPQRAGDPLRNCAMTARTKRRPAPTEHELTAAIVAAASGRGRKLARIVKGFSEEDLAIAFGHIGPRHPVSFTGLHLSLCFAAGRKEQRARMARMAKEPDDGNGGAP